MQQTSDQVTNPVIKAGHRRVVLGTVCVSVGGPVTLYFGIGSLFVAGAVQRGDPSVSRVAVWVMALLALAGVVVFTVGLALITRAERGSRVRSDSSARRLPSRL